MLANTLDFSFWAAGLLGQAILLVVLLVRGRFRHLVVVDGGDLVGILSMRDIVRVWTGDGASCEVPDSVA